MASNGSTPAGEHRRARSAPVGREVLRTSGPRPHPSRSNHNQERSDSRKMLQTNDTVSVIAEGLSQLSPEELAELDRIVTPRAAALFAKAFGPEFHELLDPLTRDDGPDGQPQAVAAEDESLSGGQPAAQTDERKLREMMRDPRYWRDKDPDYMDQVAGGFRRLYPS